MTLTIQYRLIVAAFTPGGLSRYHQWNWPRLAWRYPRLQFACVDARTDCGEQGGSNVELSMWHLLHWTWRSKHVASRGRRSLMRSWQWVIFINDVSWVPTYSLIQKNTLIILRGVCGINERLEKKGLALRLYAHAPPFVRRQITWPMHIVFTASWFYS